MWILTREINEYDQDGAYFVAAWLNKPHHLQLHDVGVPYKYMNHVMNGGGRKKTENEWHNLFKYVSPEQK